MTSNGSRGQIAIATLLRRPHARLAVSPKQLQRLGGIILRGPDVLPVSLA